MTGFRTSATAPLEVEARQVARVDLKMGVGGVAENLSVVSVSPILQTETSTVGEVISGNTVQSLPLNGRNTSQLALLLPGTVTYNPRGFTNIGAINSNRPFVNGNREQTNNFTVDGLDVNETVDNRVAYQPSPDAIAQISVETNNYAADTGNVGGAVISSVIKSGTNKFPATPSSSTGTAISTPTRGRTTDPPPRSRRESSTSTAARWAVRSSATRSSFLRTTRGRDRTPLARRSPRSRQKHGGGETCRASVQLRDPLTGQPFPGNQIPVERFSATARAILNDTTNYPLPNRTVPGGITGNYVGDTLLAIRAHQGDARLDWSQSADNKFFGRYSFARYEDRRDVQPFPLVLTTGNDQPFDNVGFNWNRVFGSSMVNELLVGFSNTTVINNTVDWAGIGDANAAYGIAGGQPIAGLSQIGWGNGLTLPGRSPPTPIRSPRHISSTRS